MKKYLLLTALFLTTTAQADFWSNCTTYGGTIITANKYGDDKGGLCNDPNDPNLTNNCNGKRFCRGGNPMNWWSAFTWCEAIGGKLASFESMCPGTQALGNAVCPNLKVVLDTTAWTALGRGTDQAWSITSSGLVLWYGTGRTSKRDDDPTNKKGGWALCEEK
ncbi:MAG: hypothetical protein J6Y85_01870 [Alphaproteobacteria bacterium]|nr:hypothetical protein [Alphaproteobacteria bacterium]